ncbi:hypothetical protein BSB_19250 [Bacillus stercoris]|nr:hypothetical protein BSB_19250 [Bacillus stercoris]
MAPSLIFDMWQKLRHTSRHPRKSDKAHQMIFLTLHSLLDAKDLENPF